MIVVEHGFVDYSRGGMTGAENPQPTYPQARELSISDIDALVDKCVLGADRAKRAGFDGVGGPAERRWINRTGATENTM